MGEALAGRRRWIVVAAAVVVLALIGYGVVHALTAGATEKPKAVATAAVDKGAVTTEVATTGTLQPAQTRSLSFAVSSTVTSVSVRAGTTVDAGQVLAKVDSTDAAQAVDDAQDSLDQAESALTTARSNATKTTGCNVAAAYTSATASPSVSASASASPSAGATTASPTPTATKKATSTPRATRATTSTCATTGGQQGGGQNQNSGSDPILSAEQRVTSATTTLEQAEEALEGATITAPIAGRVISVSGKVGSQVSSGSAFITLADVYDMQISADFPEADADRLAVGQHGVITLADQVGKEFKSTVVQVDPTGTSDGTMVRYGVLLAFDDAPTDLLVGQSASVKVTTGSKADVLRVPSTAVHDLHGTSGTVLKDGAQVAVGVGLRGDQYTEITSGLAEGDTVVRSW